MRKFELHITWKDWIFIIVIAIIFSSSISFLLYEGFNLPIKDGLISGSVLGFCLSLFSFALITFNNNFILPHLKQTIVWWILSAFFSFIAGFSGFNLAFFLLSSLNLVIPPKVVEKKYFFAIIVGFLNYLVGLLIYLFINMKSKKGELEILLLESRLLSLNIQLNTHFLFNVLNNITELMSIDKKKAEEALIKLSHFLRRVLKGKDIFTVEEELENVKTYVELENIRYSGLINLKITNEESFLQEKIPRFSVQLLVENAIKHGFKGKPLNIEIIFERSNNKIKIHVVNDGINPEEVIFGTGLNNLSKRLKLLCNGKIEYKKDKNPKFTIMIEK